MTRTSILAILFLPGVLAAIADQCLAAAPPIRTANARNRQVDPTQLPPPPIPGDPGPGPFQSPVGTPPAPLPGSGNVNPGATPTPLAPSTVPAPDGGVMYSQPLGTIKERVPPPKQFYGDPDGQGSYHSPTNAPLPSRLTVPPLEPHAPQASTDRFGFAPPPGNLGHTYHRRSRPVDEKKHPRVGMVDVHLSENYDVSAKGLKSKWNGKVWELESDPLLPGIPHIFEVKAEWGPEGARQKEIRTIRLVMGRVVDLDF